ncbi:unknown [Choristoneura fumiferana multiple nucleopolyhedrovirus]|uniref:Uncharacterized protein n=1 Tax=Choristoneura fumiferana nuclear polyhedrosis virus TaxID=208973 RepID=Q7TLP2_NPVCF|nr:unknown [Choristoneura fumiferana multiple nucleopolyhedrovirus]AAP29889.1 unknown [Choristoneura fumiferana multiple nucleopolyhedrovirus]
MSCTEPTPVEKLIASIENQLKIKDDQLRKTNELIEKYMSMLEEKDKRIQELYNSLLEMSELPCNTPPKATKHPCCAWRANSIVCAPLRAKRCTSPK